MKRTVIILCCFFITALLNSQELKKVIVKNENCPIHEEYFVLKENKTIKHGVYIKYLEWLSVQKYIMEFGIFDHNIKTGTWCIFNITHPQNPLNIVGEYLNGEKIGEWLYFFPPELRDSSVFTIFGYNKLTTVIEPRGKNKQYQVVIDTTGIKLAASGNYDKNKKSGIWRYYSKDGCLIKQYDFSNNKMIYNIKNDSVSFTILGGIDLFKRQLHQILIEENNKLMSFQPSDMKFEIITNANTLFVNNLTKHINDPLSEFIEDRIKNMPMDWIDYDPIFEKISFSININFINTKDSSVVNIETSKPRFNKE